MSQIVSVLTEAPGAATPPQVTRLELPDPRILLRDLIALQVRSELASLAARPAPSSSPPRRSIPTPEAAVATALAEFTAGRLFAVVDDRQVSSLDAEIEVGEASQIRLVRLVPLVGG